MKQDQKKQSETEQLLARSKGLHTFWITAQIGLGKPHINAGFIIVGDKSLNNKNYIVIKAKDFAPQFTIDEMEGIRNAIRNPKAKLPCSPRDIRITSIDTTIPIDAMLLGEEKDTIFGIILFNAYKTLDYPYLNAKTDLCNFVTCVHAYISGIPAGIRGSDIILVGTDTPPHSLRSGKQQFVLVDTDPSNGGSLVVRPTDSTFTFTTPADAFAFTNLGVRIRSSNVSLIGRIIQNSQKVVESANLVVAKLGKQSKKGK